MFSAPGPYSPSLASSTRHPKTAVEDKSRRWHSLEGAINADPAGRTKKSSCQCVSCVKLLSRQ
ncbi:hypothetical protein BKA66DRAFT_85552 [Pyrenochaeta sp. MPI-SDFR-AT-0127]|nr:hypothetical protein BKA66DRAFT_85552 [Pyrenochaeta sp. MPI-SDFR-AT-0127]